VLTPLLEPPAQVCWLKVQGSTDIHKGEWPAVVIAEQPFLGFLGQTPLASRMRYKLFLVATEGVVEHGAHQGNLTLEVRRAACGTVELLGEHRV
jgi:hypothetical protein